MEDDGEFYHFTLKRIINYDFPCSKRRFQNSKYEKGGPSNLARYGPGAYNGLSSTHTGPLNRGGNGLNVNSVWVPKRGSVLN